MKQETLEAEFKDFSEFSDYATEYISQLKERGCTEKDSIALSEIVHNTYISMLSDVTEYVRESNIDLHILIGMKNKLIESLVSFSDDVYVNELGKSIDSLAHIVLNDKNSWNREEILKNLRDIGELIGDYELPKQAQPAQKESILSGFCNLPYDSTSLAGRISFIKYTHERFRELASLDPNSIEFEELDMIKKRLENYLKRAYSSKKPEGEEELKQVSSDLFMDLVRFYQRYDNRIEIENEDGYSAKYTLEDELVAKIESGRAKQRLKKIVPEVSDEWVAEQIKKEINSKIFEAMTYLDNGFPQPAMNAVNYIRRKLSSTQPHHAALREFNEYIEDKYLTELDRWISASSADKKKDCSYVSVK